MNINIISCQNKKCGIGRYTNELGKKLHEWGEDVTVFRKDSPEAPLFKVYPHRSFRNLRHFVAPYYLQKAIAKKNPDIWHADYVDAASAFAYQNTKPLGNLYVNVHDAIPFMFPTSSFSFEFYKRQLKFTDKYARKILVVSEVSKNDLVKYAGIRPERIEVIYNGINHDIFYPDKVKKENKVFTMRYVGGLSGAHKNAEMLIEMANILEREGFEFNLELGGGHPDKTALPSLVEKYNLKSVKFSGFVPDDQLRSYLAEADLFVYPSKYEGFGFPPLEAMASGTATLSSNAGSLAEVLGQGATTTEPHAELFAKEVVKIMYKPGLKTDMEKQAVRQAAKYTWDRSADEHLNLYERSTFQKKLIQVA